MTNTIDTPNGQLPPPVPPAPARPEYPERRRSAGHIVAIIVGVLLLIPGLGLLVGGGAITLASSVADDGGFFDVTLDRFESEGIAVATVDLWEETDDEDWPWVLDWLDLDVRIRAVGASGSDEIFIGVARSGDVEAYLAGTAFSELIEIDNRQPRYLERSGSTEISAPGSQDFWTQQVSGGGEQELTWEARGGNWSVVLMNADGSPDVAADLQVGVHSGAVMPIAIVLLVVGGLMSIGAVILIVIGARGRGAARGPAQPQPAWPDPE